MITVSEGLCFDDVLLRPKYSDISSRANVDLSVEINDFTFKHPFVPANMKTIMGYEMAKAVYLSGGLTLIHRFMPLEEQIDIIDKLKDFYHTNQRNVELKDPMNYIGVSVGIKNTEKETVDQFIKLGVKIFCIDIAHAHSKAGVAMTKWIKNKYPQVLLIAGSIATWEGATALWTAGADVVKTGIGNGSICSTRLVTGNGVPQLTALIDIVNAKDYMEQELGRKLYIMSDGGKTVPADFVKALCMADLTMSGNMFAGIDETPSESKLINGVLHKQYSGSSTHKTDRIEGVQGWVPSKGKFADILHKLVEALQSGCSYQGAHNLEELKHNPMFIKISSAGLKESQIHNVLVE